MIQSGNLKSQSQLNQINEWTKGKKMQLNIKKTKNMIFNFSKKHQFTTKLNVNDKNIEMVRETALLGTVISDKLTWDKNTEELAKKGYKRMQLLNAASAFTNNRQELKDIYLTFVRSILEQSAVVWHSSLSVRNKTDLERIQKAAVRVIIGNEYSTYRNGLKSLKLDTLEKRREILCLRFAKNCLKHEKMKNLFPLNKTKHCMKKRKQRKFQTKQHNTNRYKKSALPYMRKLLNIENAKKNQILENS